MLDWKLPVAIAIGFFFVYLSNKKVMKKLKNHPKNKKDDERET